MRLSSVFYKSTAGRKSIAQKPLSILIFAYGMACAIPAPLIRGFRGMCKALTKRAKETLAIHVAYVNFL
jgi:hypothetical protein